MEEKCSKYIGKTSLQEQRSIYLEDLEDMQKTKLSTWVETGLETTEAYILDDLNMLISTQYQVVKLARSGLFFVSYTSRMKKI